MSRQIGDRVFVTADNYGSPATIIETRESDGSPASHYKVQTDTGDQFWAFDYEIGDAMTYDSTQDTQEHISKVQARIQECINVLTIRAAHHDRSKLAEPEKSAYDNLMRFKSSHDMVYGSPDYAEGLKILGPALDHHYAANDHHPQHWTWPLPESAEAEEIAALRHDIEVLESLPAQTEGGLELRVIARLKRDLAVLESPLNAMSLLSALEMLCDHKAAGERFKDGSIEQSMEVNRNRFGYSDQSYNFFRNTVKELDW